MLITLLSKALTGCVALAVTAPTVPLSSSMLASGEAKFGLGFAYLDTTANFDRDGNKAKLAGNGSFTAIQGELFTEFGAAKDLTLMLGIPFTANSVTGPSTLATAGTTAATVSNSGSGIGDARAALRFEPVHAPVRAMFEVELQYPFYSRPLVDEWANLSSSTPMPLGTGVSEFTGFMRIEVPLSPDFWLGGGLGYTARTGGFSNLLPYEAYLKYEHFRGVYVQFGVRGYATVTDDQFSALPASALPKDRSSASIDGSAIYNAINPTAHKASATIGTYFGDNVFLNAGAEIPLGGKNIPEQPVFLAVLGFDLGGTKPDSGYTHSNRGFQPYYLTCKVVRVNNQLRQVLIDRGSADLIRVGELLDLFEPDHQDGSFGETVARGRVLEVGPTKSKLQVLEYFKEINLQEGFVVRRPVR